MLTHDAQAAPIEITIALLSGLLTFVNAIFIALLNDLIEIGILSGSDPVLIESHATKQYQDDDAARRKDIGQVRVWPIRAESPGRLVFSKSDTLSHLGRGQRWPVIHGSTPKRLRLSRATSSR